MFWRFGLQSSSNIDSLLEKENVKLEEILEEVDFLQECKSKNQKLLEFLSKPETVIKLLDYIAKLHLVPVHLPPTPTTQTSPDTPSTTTDKKDESGTQNTQSSTSNQAQSDQQTMEPLFDEKLLIKFPYLVSELFSIDAAELLDAVLNTPNLLPNFINTILDLPPPINPTQASYWAKVMAQFMIKKTTPTLRIIKNTENIIQKLMKHAVLNMSIMDVTMKLIGVEELPDGRNEHMIEWLSQQKFIPLLVDHLDPNLSPDIHGSVATAMLDIIAISQAVSFDGVPMEVNVLIKELKSEATVQRMVKYMLDRQAPNSSSTLIQVISVVVEFIRRNYDEPPGMLPQGTPPSDGLQGRLPPAPMNLSGIIRVFCLHLQHFQELLRNPRACQPIETTVGKIVPLGQERLRICELLAELLRCAIDDVHYTETPINPPSQQPPTQPPPPSQTIESLTSPMAVDSPKSPPSNTTDDDDAKSQTSDATDSSVPTTAIGTTPSESKTDQTSTQTSTSSSQPPITVKIETSPSYTLDGVSSLNGPELQALLVKQFADTKIIVTALDLFFAFPWNNLLHGLVYDLIALSLNAPMDKCKALALSVLKDGQLTKRITAAQRSSDYEATQPKGVRLGYMGHLTIIADEVCKWYEREEVLRNELQGILEH
ncbi:SIT4 phosphatase-associated protein-domain-containing protein [Paraphysoderma sedebokerense]|nr:SIT4 phosphatase-associated protein-domain-containing protein [Paraphysoderma sedebokerense]